MYLRKNKKEKKKEKRLAFHALSKVHNTRRAQSSTTMIGRNNDRFIRSWIQATSGGN